MKEVLTNGQVVKALKVLNPKVVSSVGSFGEGLSSAVQSTIVQLWMDRTPESVESKTIREAMFQIRQRNIT